MKIGIIGGTGMLGHHLAVAAHLRQYEVVIIHRQSSDLSKLSDLTFESRIADLSDRGSMIRAMKGLDYVALCGAYYPTAPKPLTQELKTARLQMQFFIDAVEHSTVQKAMYVGSSITIPKSSAGISNEEGTYAKEPDTTNPYIRTKWLMEEMAKMGAEKGLPITIGIPTMTFGEYDYAPSTGRLITQIANQEMSAYIEGQRNVVYAGDAARGLLLTLEKGNPGERYLITGENTSIKEIADLVCQKANIPLLKKVIPQKAAQLISKLGEIRYTLFRGELPKISSTAIAVLTQGQHLEGSKAREELGYKPELTLKDTLDRTYDWFKKEGYIR